MSDQPTIITNAHIAHFLDIILYLIEIYVVYNCSTVLVFDKGALE